MMKNKDIRTLFFCSALMLCAVSVAMASGEAHHDAGALWKDFIFRSINFIVLVGALGYFVFTPIKNALIGRSKKVAADLEEAKEARLSAEAKYQEICLKLQNAQEEIENLRAVLEKEGIEERDKIVSQGNQLCGKIQKDADKWAAIEVENARTELRREMSQLAISLASEMIKKNIDSEDQEKLVSNYLKAIGDLH